MNASRRRCAVLGNPIAHSLSPVLHRAGYAAAELDWDYDAIELGEDALAAFLDGLDKSWRGLSLTMPLKRTVIPLVDELSERALQAKAANTVVLEGGRRIGHNTDIPGAVAAVRERYDGPVRTACILGGGATAASTLLALADLGCREVTLVVREPDRATATVAAGDRHPEPPTVKVRRFDELDAVPFGTVDVLVSTIPVSAQTRSVIALAAQADVVFDVIYDPWPTPLASYAHDHDKVLVSGLDLLVHQAALQLTLMADVHPAPLAAMRRAGEEVLAGRIS